MSVEFSVGTVDEMERVGAALLDQHYDELTLHKENVKLNVDWERYRSLERARKLLPIFAKLDGELIGYSVFILGTNMHYMDLKTANNDVLFLAKPYRKGTTVGIRLILESEKRLRQLGVNKVIWHIKKSRDFGPILARMGYIEEEVLMGKILESDHGV
jgi:hypothetical protein